MKYVLIGLLVLLVLLVGVGLVVDTHYSIEERITIDAPADEVHVWVGDLEKWDDWAPWVENDPSIVSTYGDTTTGVGAHQSWTSDSGDGELTLTSWDPKTGIAYDMAFIQGDVRAPSKCAMLYEGGEQSTTVVWTMEGDVGDMMPPVIAGLFALILPGQISGMFNQGLEKLKMVVETGSET